MSNIDKLKKGVPSPESAFKDLFGDHEYIKQVPLADLSPYPKQEVFRQYSEQKMSELVDDISQNGLHQPIIVQPIAKNGYKLYEILAGHHRVLAHEILGLEKISAIIKENLSAEMADLIFVNTNLNQRDELVYSEKARAYKIQYEANKNQGKRTDIDKDNFRTPGPEVNTENERTIRRYIRLTELTEHLLSLVDEKKLPMKAGVALSYISSDEQDVVHNYIIDNKISISVEQAENIKKYRNDFNEVITIDILDKMFKAEVKEKNKSTDIKLNIVMSEEIFNERFGNMDKKTAEIKLDNILEEYFSK